MARESRRLKGARPLLTRVRVAMSPITTHPRLVRTDRVRRYDFHALDAGKHPQPDYWTRSDTLYVLLVLAAIAFCACVGFVAL